jgi:hypothetical protein
VFSAYVWLGQLWRTASGFSVVILFKNDFR